MDPYLELKIVKNMNDIIFFYFQFLSKILPESMPLVWKDIYEILDKNCYLEKVHVYCFYIHVHTYRFLQLNL